MASTRQRLEDALEGKPVTRPVYVVYDAFLPNPDVDWEWLFSLGLGRVNHANVVKETRPNCEIVETTRREAGLERRDVTLRSPRGELHEYYLGDSRKGLLPWRMEHFIKQPSDYRVLAAALEGTSFEPSDQAFDASESELGGSGVTIAHVDRTPFQKIQIDYAGMELFAYHLADQEPALRELLELMNALKLTEFASVAKSRARWIKLWENLGVDAVGPVAYRQHIVPVYEAICRALRGTGTRLMVHYDGRIRLASDDIARLRLDIDSLTPPPEGDMLVGEARELWPESFLWLHPSLTLFERPPEEIGRRICEMARAAGPRLFCFEISEGIPPRWREGFPAVLRALQGLQDTLAGL